MLSVGPAEAMDIWLQAAPTRSTKDPLKEVKVVVGVEEAREEDSTEDLEEVEEGAMSLKGKAQWCKKKKVEMIIAATRETSRDSSARAWWWVPAQSPT